MGKKTLKELLLRIVQSRYVNRWIILTIDTSVSVLASFITWFIVRDVPFPHVERQLTHSPLNWTHIGIFFSASIIFSLGCLLALKIHRIILRHSTFYIVRQIFLFAVCKSLLLLLLFGLLTQDISLEATLFVLIDFLLSFFLLSNFRMVVLATFSWINGKKDKQMSRSIIVGINQSINVLIQKIEYSSRFNTSIRAIFMDQISGGNSARIGRKPVLKMPSIDELINYIDQHNIQNCFFSTPDFFNQYKDYAKELVTHGVRLFVEQELKEANKNELDTKNRSSKKHLKEIQIEDLLGRVPIVLNQTHIANFIANKVVLVTGAAGSIGSELVRQVSQLGAKAIVALDSAETPMHNLTLEMAKMHPDKSFFYPIVGDIRSEKRLDYVIKRFSPNIVFHAAAYKHVPLMEDNPCEAITTNVRGTYLLAHKCVEYGIERMVMISTDKAVSPTNVMGASKRACEKIIQSLDYAIKNGELGNASTIFATTRFGNVLGSNGSVIPLFKKQLEQGGPLTVTDKNVTRFFMTIPEACQLVLEAGTMSQGGEIFLFDMGHPIKIDTLARQMIYLAGLEPDKDINIVYTGLRPGEKLTEELLTSDEHDLPTPHPKIKVARSRYTNYQQMKTHVEQLIETAQRVEMIKTVTLLKEFVPEFKSNNSEEYERIDKLLEKVAR